MPKLEHMTTDDLRRVLADTEQSFGWASTSARLLRRELERRLSGGISMPQSELVTARRVIAAAGCLGQGMSETFLAKHYSADVMERAYPRRRMGLKGMIAAACALDGRPAPLHDDGPAEWLSAGFSTVSLPGILGDSANKALLEGYESLPAVVPIFFGKRTVTNFREYTEYRMTGDETFDLVPPGGELRHGTLTEEHEHYQAKTYGKMFTIDRTMIVNDDLGAFLAIPRRFGRGAALTREKAGAKLVLDNGLAGDFFHAARKNLCTGIGSALSAAGLGAAAQKMLEQTDDAAGKNPILLDPKLILVPPALKGTADDLFILQVITANVTNKYRGLYTPFCWPYLGNAAFHASASSAYWYLFADPANVAAFLVAYLNGIDAPTVEEVAASPNVLGRCWRAYFDFGVAEGDPRAALRSNGA